MQGRKEEKRKTSWEERSKSRKMDLTSNKEKLTTVSGICAETEKVGESESILEMGGRARATERKCDQSSKGGSNA